MKKVINGKCYDTAKATKIHEWDNGLYSTDFGHCTEILYKTPKGSWFLYGEGGAMSAYASPALGGGKGAGWDIIPMSADEARQWLEEHGADEETIGRHFTIEDA